MEKLSGISNYLNYTKKINWIKDLEGDLQTNMIVGHFCFVWTLLMIVNMLI